MSKNVVVVCGVCQTDFYNQKIFESVGDKLHDGLELFKSGSYEYVGVRVRVNDSGRVTEKFIKKAVNKFKGKAFGAMANVEPKFYTIEGDY